MGWERRTGELSRCSEHSSASPLALPGRNGSASSGQAPGAFPGHPDPAPGACFPGSSPPRAETLPADFPAAPSRHGDLVTVFVTGEGFLAFLPLPNSLCSTLSCKSVKGPRAFLPARNFGMARWETAVKELAELQSIGQPGWKCFGRLQAKTTLPCSTHHCCSRAKTQAAAGHVALGDGDGDLHGWKQLAAGRQDVRRSHAHAGCSCSNNGNRSFT